MWQFQQAVRGLADGCAVLGIPVTGGNVSFYNQTGLTAILPTPVVGVLGVIDDVTRRIPTGFAGAAGHVLYLLGETREEFGGSEWAHVVHGHLGGQPPAVDLEHEKLLAAVLADAAHDGLISAAHDLSEGGLAQALVESCLIGNTGCRITLTGDPFVQLFSESAGRVIVAIPPAAELRIAEICTERGLPHRRIGVVEAIWGTLEIEDVATLPLDELRATWEATLPALFG
jgi:phosphoribosylformylglycinamidine synthase